MEGKEEERMTKPKTRIATLFVDGKPARILGMVAGFVVVQIWNRRPICLSIEELDAKVDKT